jgi:hypothetical protein
MPLSVYYTAKVCITGLRFWSLAAWTLIMVFEKMLNIYFFVKNHFGQGARFYLRDMG